VCLCVCVREREREEKCVRGCVRKERRGRSSRGTRERKIERELAIEEMKKKMSASVYRVAGNSACACACDKKKVWV